MPCGQGGGLVGAHDQDQLRTGLFIPQLMQGIEGVGGAVAQHFAAVDHHSARKPRESQPHHRKAVLRRRERSALVPGLAGGNDVQLGQAEL